MPVHDLLGLSVALANTISNAKKANAILLIFVQFGIVVQYQ
jgi:hypothetical protein